MSEQPSEPFLLIADARPAFRLPMVRLFKKQGFVVREADSGAAALKVISDFPVAVAVIDSDMPDITGRELISALLLRSPGTICIALAQDGSAALAAELLDVGARDYFDKPISDWQRFDQAIRDQFTVWRTSQELAALRGQVRQMRELRESDSFEELKGNSPAMQSLIRQIRLLGPLPVPVLIRGESGTGKELVARALHRQHTTGAFVPVNCAAIPRELFESELFGHEQGSFTGALRREGMCAAAAGGTLFLDEVGDMPLELQAKLLRVIEQREYRRVGTDRPIPLKARIIAATNVDLEAAIEQGRFREDLYFRLSAQEIWVPPLRERRADIQLLAYHFVQKYNRLFDRAVQRVTPAALRLLERHDWARNNVRELDRAVQRAMVWASESTELTPEMLFRGQPEPVAVEAATDLVEAMLEGLTEMPYKDAMVVAKDRIARWYLRHFLQAASWKQTEAAELAGMQRTYLARMMKKLAISEPTG
ncbi:MAG: sigma-54 dependent transcriptional regulator [Myxococcota bacterium]